MKTFSLYARMPEEYFDRIKIAEKDTEAANIVFRELSAIYKSLYFNDK
jgi:hypothetical protein